jgi:hypothetical protein
VGDVGDELIISRLPHRHPFTLEGKAAQEKNPVPFPVVLETSQSVHTIINRYGEPAGTGRNKALTGTCSGAGVGSQLLHASAMDLILVILVGGRWR